MAIRAVAAARINLDYTRAMITAALNGSLANVGYRSHSIFGVAIPMTCPNVPSMSLMVQF